MKTQSSDRKRHQNFSFLQKTQMKLFNITPFLLLKMEGEIHFLH